MQQREVIGIETGVSIGDFIIQGSPSLLSTGAGGQHGIICHHCVRVAVRGLTGEVLNEIEIYGHSRVLRENRWQGKCPPHG
jgi:hypothetical protein